MTALMERSLLEHIPLGIFSDLDTISLKGCMGAHPAWRDFIVQNNKRLKQKCAWRPLVKELLTVPQFLDCESLCNMLESMTNEEILSFGIPDILEKLSLEENSVSIVLFSERFVVLRHIKGRFRDEAYYRLDRLDWSLDLLENAERLGDILQGRGKTWCRDYYLKSTKRHPLQLYRITDGTWEEKPVGRPIKRPYGLASFRLRCDSRTKVVRYGQFKRFSRGFLSNSGVTETIYDLGDPEGRLTISFKRTFLTWDLEIRHVRGSFTARQTSQIYSMLDPEWSFVASAYLGDLSAAVVLLSKSGDLFCALPSCVGKRLVTLECGTDDAISAESCRSLSLLADRSLVACCQMGADCVFYIWHLTADDCDGIKKLASKRILSDSEFVGVSQTEDLWMVKKTDQTSGVGKICPVQLGGPNLLDA